MRYPKPTRTAPAIVCGLIGSAAGPLVMLAGGAWFVLGVFITIISVIWLLIGIGNLLGALDNALLDRWETSVLDDAAATPDSTEDQGQP